MCPRPRPSDEVAERWVSQFFGLPDLTPGRSFRFRRARNPVEALLRARYELLLRDPRV
jgi:hypothetical protein